MSSFQKKNLIVEKNNISISLIEKYINSIISKFTVILELKRCDSNAVRTFPDGPLNVTMISTIATHLRYYCDIWRYKYKFQNDWEQTFSVTLYRTHNSEFNCQL